MRILLIFIWAKLPVKNPAELTLIMKGAPP